MKTLLITFLFVFAFCRAQSSHEKAVNELKQLHQRTNFVRDSIGKLISNSNHKVKAATDKKTKEALLLSTDSLWNISDQNDIEALKINIEYCKTHPTSMYAFERVAAQISGQSGKNFYADFEAVYKNAPIAIRESETGQKMAEQLVRFKQSMVGSEAPEIRGLDLLNQPISLADYTHKKYILIDFWASWCGPCREELPFLKSLYAQYKSQGFEIISITTDEDPEKWKAAIAKDGIQEWKHFSIFQNKSSAKEDYFVYGIPHKILIDKNGMIIGKWKASGELNKNELRRQLAQIFGN